MRTPRTKCMYAMVWRSSAVCACAEARLCAQAPRDLSLAHPMRVPHACNLKAA